MSKVGASATIVVGDAGERADLRGNRATRIDQRVEDQLGPVARAPRTTASSVTRSSPEARVPGGLDVHHRERAVDQQRRPLRAAGQRPAAVAELPHARVGAEEGHREAGGHRGRRRGEPQHVAGEDHRRRPGPPARSASARSASVEVGWAESPVTQFGLARW